MSVQRKNRNRGKRHERNIAKLLNGKRLGVLGKHDVADNKGVYSIECKSREKLPKWFVDFWDQTIRNCEEGKIPLLVIHKLKQKYLEDWVVIRLEDFLEAVNEKD